MQDSKENHAQDHCGKNHSDNNYTECCIEEIQSSLHHTAFETNASFPEFHHHHKKKHSSKKCSSLQVSKEDEVDEVNEDEEEDKLKNRFKHMKLHFSFEKSNIDSISEPPNAPGERSSRTPKLNLLVDPVIEEKEEGDIKQQFSRVYSPRLKVHTDKVEDLNSAKMKSSHSQFFNSNLEEVIAEDVDCENQGEVEAVHKISSSSKIIFESSIDKSEGFDNPNINIVEINHHVVEDSAADTIVEEKDDNEDDSTLPIANAHEKLEHLDVIVKGDEIDNEGVNYKLKPMSGKNSLRVDEEPINEADEVELD